MGNWKDVVIGDRKIRINTIKWYAFEDLFSGKRPEEKIKTNEVMKACLSQEDWEQWASFDYDPDNAELIKQRDDAILALMEMNPKLFPKKAAGQTVLSSGTSGEPSIGSPKSSDGPSTK